MQDTITMNNTVTKKFGKPRDFVAKDLRTPKYHMRVVKSKKVYNRQESKRVCNSYFI